MLVDSSVHELIVELTRQNITQDRIRLVYFVGVGTTNGHAFEYDGYYYVWLPLETYDTARRTKVFVAHELLHALHYRESPAFHFNSKPEQIQVARRLITEGLASYLSARVLQLTAIEALWADYLTEEDAKKWWDDCVIEEAGLYQLISDQFLSSDPEIGLFYADDPTNIYRYRAGYFAGLRLVERFTIARCVSARDLIQIPRAEFERDVLALMS